MKLWKACLAACCSALIGTSGTPAAAGGRSAPVDAAQVSSHFDGVPILSRITVASPDSAGLVAIAGLAGAVPASSYLFLTTLETGHWTTVQASADGSFTSSLPAVPGASILVKADRTGFFIPPFVARSGVLINGHAGELTSVPGTIARVPDPAPGADGSIPFAGAGQAQHAFAWWNVVGTLNRASFLPGESIAVSGTLHLFSEGLERATSDIRSETRLFVIALSRPDGSGALDQNTFASTLPTPTGLGVERVTQGSATTPVTTTMTRVGPRQAQGTFTLSYQVPQDLPAGFYRPMLAFRFLDLPTPTSAPHPANSFLDGAGRRSREAAHLPVIRIGSPAPPRLFAALMTDVFSQGTRGLIAVEDRGRFAVASRIVTSTETFVVPRMDPAGQPVSYTVEPYALTVGLSDRGAPPNPPTIPFRFPSGSLTVRVVRPDGNVEVIGPAPFRQFFLAGPTRNGHGMEGGGHITDAFQLTTLDPRFHVQFGQDGKHVIEVQAEVEDVWGNLWRSGGSYEIYAAKPLALDTSVLPGTSFEVGDTFNAGLSLVPPFRGEIEVRVRFAPQSDATRMIERTIRGLTNRFGYFQPVGRPFSFDEPGEYRVDVTASGKDTQGNLSMGSRTWGGVVASHQSPIIAHGRRGIDDQRENRQPWFFRTQTGVSHTTGGHVQFPFHAGDVTWLEDRDASIPLLSFQDPGGELVALLRRLTPGRDFDERALSGETTLSSGNFDGRDVHFDPVSADVRAYSYRSVQRPLVRVREEITEEGGPGFYWRFNDLFGGQIGNGGNGDLLNDFKFQYGGVVLRGRAIPQPQYAIYGSLFVLVANDDPLGGTRTFPPFQGNGGGPTGGPLFTLKGKPIDIFFHPTGTRPGSILEIGNVVSFPGQIGPTLPSKVRITVTSPSGRTREIAGQANRVGWFYQPTSNFFADEPGAWKVRITVWHDGATSAGQVQAPFPTGDVLGSTSGEFSFYVVERDAPELSVALPDSSSLRPADGPIDIPTVAPAGVTNPTLQLTTTMPGFLLEERAISGFTYRYDAPTLARDFPNLDLRSDCSPQGCRNGTDVVTMSFLASGTDSSGRTIYRARQVTLVGDELYAPAQPPAPVCSNTETTLCLNGGRFEVRSNWRAPDGSSGIGRAVPLTADTGYFWFFHPDNVELVVKALNACTFNSRHWVFAGGLTNVEVELTATDTATGTIQTYTNPLGRAFRPIQDTDAFPTCDVSTAAAPFTETSTHATSVDQSFESCSPSGTTLCLSGGRFQVEASWRTGAGQQGAGQAIRLTNDTGYFWFFGPDNVEVVMKVLNACSFSGAPRFWVFGAGLTDVEVTIRVTDTSNGEVRTYANPLGTPFPPLQDTSAFATCP